MPADQNSSGVPADQNSSGVPADQNGSGVSAAWCVFAAGVCAALHVGKLAPAIAVLQQALGLTLLQTGFLLSLVQAAGMLLGLALGAAADGLGARQSIVLGLMILGVASVAGGAADGVTVLMLLRAAEGVGLLLVLLPAPGLMRQRLPPALVSRFMGLWGAYMPLATALALLLGPLCIQAWGWRTWWWGLGGLSLAMAVLVWRLLATAPLRAAAGAGAGGGAAAPVSPSPSAWLQRLRDTVAAPGPWMLALCFACYSSQWLAVIGFLPSIVQQAGFSAAATGVFTAAVAGVNALGNITAGRLMQRGVAPARLLYTGFAAMALGAWWAFAGMAMPGADSASPASAWHAAMRYAAVLLFSGVGGLIPATLFALALRVAPTPHTVATTVGWMQQWSSLGQFAGPPTVAAVASTVGGWHYTGLVTGACCALGVATAVALSRQTAGPLTPQTRPTSRV